MGSVHSGDKESKENFGTKISWKTFIWKTGKQTGE